MARHQSDREDLYEELQHVVPRWEFLPGGRDVPVVAGIRNDGRLLLYVSPDLVFQFDSGNRLLRAYRDGDLYRTQGTTLARLRRQRTGTASELVRHDLSDGERDAFLGMIRNSLQGLVEQLPEERESFLRTTETGPAAGRLLKQRLLACLAAGPTLAPAYRTRRK